MPKIYTDADAIARLLQIADKYPEVKTYMTQHPQPFTFSNPEFSKLYQSILGLAIYKSGDDLSGLTFHGFFDPERKPCPVWFANATDRDCSLRSFMSFLELSKDTYLKLAAAIRRVDPTLLCYLPPSFKGVVTITPKESDYSEWDFYCLGGKLPLPSQCEKLIQFDSELFREVPYLYGYSRGQLNVIDSPTFKSELTHETELLCVCQVCQCECELTIKDLSTHVVCPDCTSALALPEWSFDLAISRSSAFIEAKMAVIRKESLQRGRSSFAAFADKEGSGYGVKPNGAVFFNTFSQQIQARANTEAASMWRFKSFEDFLMFTGFPSTMSDHLHRIDHDENGPELEIVYAPGQTMWLPPQLNLGLHHTNTKLLYGGKKYTSGKKACEAAGIKDTTFRGNLRRERQLNPSVLPQAVFDRMVACNDLKN